MATRLRLVASVLLAAMLLPIAGSRPPSASTPQQPVLAERYFVDGDPSQVVTVSRISRQAYLVVGKGWDGVGLSSWTSYWGVFRHSWGADSVPGQGARGTHSGVRRDDGSLLIHGEYTAGLTGGFDVVWAPEPGAFTPAPKREYRPPGAPPVPGGYDELPEAIRRVPPVYPDAARRANLEGTVLVQAWVGEDGRVMDTRVLKSVPGLDGAAMEAVRQWVFKPATAGGKPVAVWVSVPVRFPPE